MNKKLEIVLKALLCVVCGIIAIFALLMAFIEARFLIALDWLVYDNAFNAFIRYFFRFLLALIAMGVGILEIINLKKKCDNLRTLLFYVEIGLVVMSVIIFAVAANYIDFICLGLSAVLLLLKYTIPGPKKVTE